MDLDYGLWIMDLDMDYGLWIMDSDKSRFSRN